MERRLAVLAGSHRQALSALVAVLVFVAPSSGVAAPKSKPAKAQFDKGVAAYQKEDFAGASVAFGKSFGLEADLETLFAWAQAERKQGHCDKASELYVKLLGMKLPAENKSVVQGQLAECKRILEDQQAADAKAAADAQAAAADVKAAAEPEAPATPPPTTPVASEPAMPAPADTTSNAWYTDPLGDTLVGLGAISIGGGIALLISGHSAETASHTAATVADFKSLDATATSRGRLGVIASATGAVLILGGVIRYATRSTHAEHTTVTGWLDGASGGLAISGGF